MRYCIWSSWSRAACPHFRHVGLKTRNIGIELASWPLVFVGDVGAAVFIREVGHRERAASSRLGARAALLLRVVVLVGKGTVGVDASRAVGRSSVLHLRVYPDRRSIWTSRSWCSGGSHCAGALGSLL